MNNPNESFPQNPANIERQKINDSVSMIYHHISQFILSSRMDDEYDQDQIAKSAKYIDELRLVLHTPEQLRKLDEFIEKVNVVDITSPKDDKVLDELQQLLETNIQSLKVSD